MSVYERTVTVAPKPNNKIPHPIKYNDLLGDSVPLATESLVTALQARLQAPVSGATATEATSNGSVPIFYYWFNEYFYILVECLLTIKMRKHRKIRYVTCTSMKGYTNNRELVDSKMNVDNDIWFSYLNVRDMYNQKLINAIVLYGRTRVVEKSNTNLWKLSVEITKLLNQNNKDTSVLPPFSTTTMTSNSLTNAAPPSVDDQSPTVTKVSDYERLWAVAKVNGVPTPKNKTLKSLLNNVKATLTSKQVNKAYLTEKALKNLQTNLIYVVDNYYEPIKTSLFELKTQDITLMSVLPRKKRNVSEYLRILCEKHNIPIKFTM